jgi:nitrous oxidase accessory protein
VTDNLVVDGRDLVVWYSSDNVLARNVVRRGRYGTHFMYSHRNRVEDNRYAKNVVGVFIMYSRDVTLERNVLAESSGPAGMGLGIKESGNVVARGNRFVNDTIGIYLDTSPLQATDANVFERNELRLGRSGVVFHSSESRNTFRQNAFRDLDVSVQVEGGGDALGVAWEGNDFDDYQGYDLDHDGVGDLPYELRSATGALEARLPDTAFFRGTPALALVDVAARVLPLFAPKLLVRDERPHMGPLAWEADHAR